MKPKLRIGKKSLRAALYSAASIALVGATGCGQQPADDFAAQSANPVASRFCNQASLQEDYTRNASLFQPYTSNPNIYDHQAQPKGGVVAKDWAVWFENNPKLNNPTDTQPDSDIQVPWEYNIPGIPAYEQQIKNMQLTQDNGWAFSIYHGAMGVTKNLTSYDGYGCHGLGGAAVTFSFTAKKTVADQTVAGGYRIVADDRESETERLNKYSVTPAFSGPQNACDAVGMTFPCVLSEGALTSASGITAAESAVQRVRSILPVGTKRIWILFNHNREAVNYADGNKVTNTRQQIVVTMKSFVVVPNRINQYYTVASTAGAKIRNDVGEDGNGNLLPNERWEMVFTNASNNQSSPAVVPYNSGYMIRTQGYLPMCWDDVYGGSPYRFDWRPVQVFESNGTRVPNGAGFVTACDGEGCDDAFVNNPENQVDGWMAGDLLQLADIPVCGTSTSTNDQNIPTP